MKSRPILFSGSMVRAVLDGSKTQTRRVGKIQSQDFVGLKAEAVRHATLGYQIQATYDAYPGRGTARHAICACPFGQPGDQLWVRETWNWFDPDSIPTDRAGPRAIFTGNQGNRSIPWVAAYAADGHLPYPGYEGRDHWRPSIHMPRWASRITLEITGVRVERLQNISEDDAKAEGCERLHDDEPGYIHREDPDWKICPKCGGTRLHNAIGASGGVIFDVDCRECDSYLKRYHHLWESINGPASWDLNPWVWVVEFRRLS